MYKTYVDNNIFTHIVLRNHAYKLWQCVVATIQQCQVKCFSNEQITNLDASQQFYYFYSNKQ